MRGRSRGFFGLSRGSLPPNFPARQPAPFRAQALFPARPPQLTADEQDLIAKHLGFYQSLDNDSWIPATDEQRHFVATCRGTAQPQTAHERAYLKWKALHRRRPVSSSHNSFNRFPRRTKETALATTKQVNYLIALGVSPLEAKAMTLKQASAKISELKAKRKAQG